MPEIKIVTDSTADLSKDQISKYEIEVVPLTVSFGDQHFSDGVDLSPEDFYGKLTTSDVLPKTSQPSPEAFRQIYERVATPEDAILSVHISGKLSGTLNSVELAAKMTEQKIFPIDTKTASQGVGLNVLIAAEAASRQMPLEKIIELTELAVKQTFSVFAVDTLEFLQRNGRIGKAASLLGSLLQIRPILFADPEGMVAPYDKVRGRSQVIPTLVNAALKNVTPDHPVNLSVVHSGALDSAHQLTEELKKHYTIVDYQLTMVGPTIGAHIGPGAVGVMLQPSFDSLLAQL